MLEWRVAAVASTGGGCFGSSASAPQLTSPPDDAARWDGRAFGPAQHGESVGPCLGRAGPNGPFGHLW